MANGKDVTRTRIGVSEGAGDVVVSDVHEPRLEVTTVTRYFLLRLI
jgi:hypothetical protein